jgi:hypothetical protein
MEGPDLDPRPAKEPPGTLNFTQRLNNDLYAAYLLIRVIDTYPILVEGPGSGI